MEQRSKELREERRKERKRKKERKERKLQKRKSREAIMVQKGTGYTQRSSQEGTSARSYLMSSSANLEAASSHLSAKFSKLNMNYNLKAQPQPLRRNYISVESNNAPCIYTEQDAQINVLSPTAALYARQQEPLPSQVHGLTTQQTIDSRSSQEKPPTKIRLKVSSQQRKSKKSSRSRSISTEPAEVLAFTQGEKPAKVNTTLHFYRQLQQNSQNSLSQRPQEVVLASSSGNGHRSQSRKESYATQDSQQALLEKRPSEPGVEVDAFQPRPHTPSGFNLVHYKSALSQQEEAFEKRLKKMRDMKVPLPEPSKPPMKPPQPVLTPVEHQSKQPSPVKKVRRPRHPSPLKREPLHASTPVVAQEDYSSQKRPRSQLGQRYINYIQRTSRGEEPSKHSLTRTLLDEKPLPSLTNLAGEPSSTTESVNPLVEIQRHKSVENVKQYCISKMIGCLDTRRALARVSQNSSHLKKARVQVNQRYKQEADRQGSKWAFRNSTQTRSSHLSSLQDTDHGSCSIPRSGQIFKKQLSQKSFIEKEKELIDKCEHSSSIIKNESFMRQTPLYTVESLQVPSELPPDDEVAYEYQPQLRQATPLRCPQAANYIENELDFKALMERSERQLAAASGREEPPYAQRAQEVLLRHSQEGRYADRGDNRFGDHADDRQLRIAQLQRQAEEVQRIPEEINERLQSLKQRTQELKEVAMNFSSTQKAGEPWKETTTHLIAPHTLAFDQQESQQLQSFRRSYAPLDDGPSPVQRDQSVSYVQQHDMTSSFLKEQQQMIQNSDYAISARISKEEVADQSSRDPRSTGRPQASWRAAPSQHRVSAEDIQKGAVSIEQQESEEVLPAKRVYLREQILNGRAQDPSNVPMSQANLHQSETSYGKEAFRKVNSQEAYPTAEFTQPDEDCAQAKERNSKHAKRERKDKHQKKIDKLKQLQELAQQSMSKIASGLTSSASLPAQIAMTQSNRQLHSSVTHASDTNLASSRNDHGSSTLEEKRESIRSQVEKLSLTRREIKKLIKIQNQHSKLLRKLQAKGLLSHKSRQKGDNSSMQHSPTSASAAASVIEGMLTSRDNQQQLTLSNALLSQMQEIFKYLKQIQQKLDHEIEERHQRDQQTLADLGQEDFPEQQTSEEEQLPYSHAQPQTEEDLTIHEVHNYQSKQSRSMGSQGAPAEHHLQQQSVAFHPQPAHHTQLHLFQAPPQLAPYSQTTFSNKKSVNSHGTNSTLFWDTQQAYNQNALFAAGQAPGQASGHPEAHGSYSAGHTDTFDHEARPSIEQLESGEEKIDSLEPPLAGGADTSIKVDQLCEILSQEIDRVRQESMMQVSEMRMQYEHELMALRQEFNAKQGLSTSIITGQPTAESQFNETQQFVQGSQPQHHVSALSSELTKRPGPSAQMQMVQVEATEHLVTAEDGDYNSESNCDQQKETTSTNLFDELQRVKAERDMYYGKLMKVRERITLGRGHRKQYISDKTLPSSTHREDPNDYMKDSKTARDSKEGPPGAFTHKISSQSSLGHFTSKYLRANEATRQMALVSDYIQEQKFANEVALKSFDTFNQEVSLSMPGKFVSTQSRDNHQHTSESTQNFVHHTEGEIHEQECMRVEGKPSLNQPYQFRSCQESAFTVTPTNLTAPSAKQEAPVPKPFQVKQTRTSMLRARQAFKNKCDNCSGEQDDTIGARTLSSYQKSVRSDKRSNTSQTCKVQYGPGNHAMTSLGGIGQSSSQQCTISHHQQTASNQAPNARSVSNKGSKAVSPFVYNRGDSGSLRGTSVHTTSIKTSSSKPTARDQKGTTPKGIVTLGNMTNDSQQLSREVQANRNIVSGPSIQTQAARSPHLISQMVAEHQQYFTGIPEEHLATETHHNDSLMMQQTGGLMNESQITGVTEQDRASKALQVITHYLEKYDKL